MGSQQHAHHDNQLFLGTHLWPAPFESVRLLPSPPATMRSRHSVTVAAVTRYLRDVLSRSAHRSSSRTTETLRFDDHRPAPAADDAVAFSVPLRAPSDATASCFFALDMHSLL